MLKVKIPFQEIEGVPSLIKDFLNQNIPEFSSYLFSLSKINEQTAKKAKSFSQEQRILLHEVLKEQMKDLQLSRKQELNLQALLSPTTFTITTGHQLNLFSGPAFFVYKILQTIKTADVLSENGPEKFVPVFWMATEDHDFEEVNHFETPNNTFKIKGRTDGAVGRKLIDDVSFIEEFENEFKDEIFGTQLILLLKKAYQKNRTWKQATQILVQELFSEFGILMIDGDDKKLKNQMSSIFYEELTQKITHHHTQETIKFLQKKYKKIQINPREINLFYLTDTRNRISGQEQDFEIVDLQKNISLEELSSDWSKISPNALLRPVFQEKVLPNVAYIGGNAEIMYWLELPKVFEAFRVDFPLLMPRSSMVFLPQKTHQKIQKIGWKIEDFFMDFSSQLNTAILQESSLPALLNQQEEFLKNNFQILKQEAAQTDKSFINLVDAEESRQLKSFARMKKRLLRAEKIKHAEYVEKLQKIFFSIHPHGVWQERVYNFSVFFAENGISWLKTCYQELDIHNSELILMEY